MKYILTILFTLSLSLLAACSQPNEQEAITDTPAQEAYSLEAGELRQVTSNGETYSVEIIDDLVIYESDMIVGTLSQLESGALISPELATQGISQDRVCNPFCGSGFWPNGIVRYEIDSGVSSTVEARINSAIAHWEANTSLDFRPRNGASDYIRFRQRSSGCSAEIGFRGGRQNINLSSGCTTGSTIHEIGHAVGLHHEQTRCDRDNFVTIRRSNIQSGKRHNFDRHCGNSYTDRGSYDFGSIMHYPAAAFSKNGNDTITCQGGCPWNMGQRVGLSTGDRNAISSMY